MSDPVATAPRERTAADIGRGLPLRAASRRLLTPDLKPGDYLNLLVQHKQYPDAIRFMAHALLNREGVWWACLCAQHTLGPDASAAELAALGAAVRWVLHPNEANQQAAQAAAQAGGQRTAAVCAAWAAYCSGSRPGPDEPLEPVDARLAARRVTGSVLAAAAQGQPTELSLNFRQFIAIGLDVDFGTNRWADRPAPKRTRQPE